MNVIHEIRLRRCIPSDGAALKKWLYPGMNEAEMADMIALWNRDEYEGRYFTMLAVWADGQMVGTVSLYAQADGSISCGPDIFPPFRRQGYAFAAVSKALERAREMGYVQATATVRKDNDASLALHRKLGFVITGERTTTHGHPAWVFQKNLMPIALRRIRPGEEAEVSALIAYTLRTTNIRDYSEEYIENDVRALSPESIRQRSEWTHFYVACEGEKIIGCGAIGPYWGKEDESSLFTIFVLPEYQGRGIGRQIIENLEQDEFFLRARRVEIPASITACQFYRKMGYDFKNGITSPDAEQLFRLEKYRNV